MYAIRWSILALLGCSGCGTVLQYLPTRDPPEGLREHAPEEVEIFMTSAPERPYVEVAMIEAQQEGMSRDDEQDVIEKMRRFAGARGCDAVRIFAGNDTTVVSGFSSPTTSRTLKGYRGACLVYTDPPPSSAAETPAVARCMPNATQLCYGPGACRGAQSCTADGRGYTPCDCGAKLPPSAEASAPRAH